MVCRIIDKRIMILIIIIIIIIIIMIKTTRTHDLYGISWWFVNFYFLVCPRQMKLEAVNRLNWTEKRGVFLFCTILVCQLVFLCLIGTEALQNGLGRTVSTPSTILIYGIWQDH